MFLALLCWVIVGAIAGLIASKFVKLHGDDPRLGLIVGAVAACIGGFSFRQISHTTTMGPGLWSLLIAAGAAGAALVLWHFVRGAAQA